MDAADETTPDPALGLSNVTIADAAISSCRQSGYSLMLVGSAPDASSSVVLSPSSALETIDCQVSASDAGSGYDFTITVYHFHQSDGQGNYMLSGHADPTGSAANVNGYFDLGRNAYFQSNCTIAPIFRQTNGQLPTPPAVGPGRFFGSIQCSGAYQIQGSDVCWITADFAFDHCQP